MDNVRDMMVAIAGNLPDIQLGIFLIFGTIGIFCIAKGLITQLRSGRDGGPVLPSTIALVVSGALMCSMPALIGVMANTVFGGDRDPRIIMAYTTTSGSNIDVSLQTIVYVVVVIGWFACGKGLLLWKAGPDSGDPKWFGRGFTYIIAATIATNIVLFADVLGYTIGQEPYGTNYLNY